MWIEIIFKRQPGLLSRTASDLLNMTVESSNASLPHPSPLHISTLPHQPYATHHPTDTHTNTTHPCSSSLDPAGYLAFPQRRAPGGDCLMETPQQQTTAVTMTTIEVTLLATILVTVFLSSAVANVFVCVVFSKRRCSLSLSNRFLANLTVCNCLFTALIMPFAFVSLVSREWLFGEVLCQCTGLVINVLVTASIFTLAVISMDRYCAVVTPLHYNMRMTRRRCWGFIAGIWWGALAVSSPPLVGWSSIKFHVNKMICTVAWDSPGAGARYYTLFLVTVSFLLPLLAMLWTYGCIFRAARDNRERTRRSSIVHTVQAADSSEGSQSTPINKRRSSSVPIIRRLSQTSSRSNSILQRREEWKTAVTSFLILFSFMLCWLPYFIVISIRSLAPALHLHPVMSTISTVAAMFGCACNPMVYVFRSKGTRQDLKVILTRRRSYRNEIVQTTFRRGGSMRGGEGSGRVVGGEGAREKGSVFWQEELYNNPAGECHSIREEMGAPGEDCSLSGSSQGGGSTVVTPHMMRNSPSLQQC
ncbi:hypothetical protein ACOMHN_018856 [Nucella lapillus]